MTVIWWLRFYGEKALIMLGLGTLIAFACVAFLFSVAGVLYVWLFKPDVFWAGVALTCLGVSGFGVLLAMAGR